MNHHLLFILIIAVFTFIAPTYSADKEYKAEEGSVELKKKKKKKSGKLKIDPSLPNVLIIGDSISMGYMSTVVSELKGKANVLHNPGNAQGTTNGLKNLETWLKAHKWTVIHFNFGLHDLKHVKIAGTSQNSNSFDDPQQADLKAYSKNLTEIVKKLKITTVPIIYATTTPYPGGVKPARLPADCDKYNDAAKAIMKANGIPVNDLHKLVKDDLKTLQKPKNVHFQKVGSAKMGKQVAEKILEFLKQ